MELPPTEVPVIISGAIGILGALVGGLISWVTQECARRAALSERRRSLASAIAAETEAYLELMDRRQHTERAEALLMRLHDGESVTLRGWLPQHEIDWDYFPFYRASISEIGILGQVCGKIARFHSLWRGVRSTILSAEAGAFEANSPKDKERTVETELQLWREMISLGDEIVSELKKQAAK